MSFENETTELSFDDLHFDDVEDQLVAAASEGILGSGTYLASGVNVKMFEKDGRQFGTIQYQLFNDEGRQLRRVRAKVSWQAVYHNGRVDKAFKMYSSLVKAIDAGTGNPQVVLPLAKEVPVKLSVSEAYLVDEHEAHEAHSDRNPTDDGKIWAILARVNDDNKEEVNAQRVHYLSKGLEPIYLVQGLYPAS